MIKNNVLFFVACGFLVILIGCGPKAPPGMPKTYPCTVTVTKGGTPLEGASVLLVSPSYPDSFAVSGRTNALGVAEIRSLLASYSTAGAPEGEATIVVSKPPEYPAGLRKSSKELAAMTVPEQEAYAVELAKAMKDVPKIVPQLLTSPVTSPVKITVKEDKSGTKLTLELDDYVK